MAYTLPHDPKIDKLPAENSHIEKYAGPSEAQCSRFKFHLFHIIIVSRVNARTSHTFCSGQTERIFFYFILVDVDTS